MLSVASVYDELRTACLKHLQPNYQYMFDDIFHDTIIYTACDVESTKKKTHNDLLEHFVYRFKMIAYSPQYTRSTRETNGKTKMYGLKAIRI
jgi:hypothetical protein